jgi:hypothetical protein
VLAACSDPASDTIGPFTGPVRRFAVDRIDVPRDTEAANAVAIDLDGDDALDNKFGYATAVLATTNDLTTDAPSMFASGALAPIVELQADDLESDASAGIRYVTVVDGQSELFEAAITAGSISSVSRADRQQGCCAVVALPVFVNADPVLLPIDDMRLALVPDANGGYEATVRGGIPAQAARDAAYQGLLQMFETEPERHLVFFRGVDSDHDDVLSSEELEGSVISLLVSADLALFGSTDDSVSIAFSMHLSPCSADGTCPLLQPGPFVACRNRVRDGLETDVDCGGADCQRCAVAKRCSAAGDCQSNACDAGSCGAPTCSDGVRDGYESDVDCGGSCPACATGLLCAGDSDCTSSNCNNGVGSRGSCQ